MRVATVANSQKKWGGIVDWPFEFPIRKGGEIGKSRAIRYVESLAVNIHDAECKSLGKMACNISGKLAPRILSAQVTQANLTKVTFVLLLGGGHSNAIRDRKRQSAFCRVV